MPTEKKLPERWEEFCQLTGRDAKILPDTSTYDEADKKHAVAAFKLMHVIRYCNGDNQPDHTNDTQRKYEPYWLVVEDKSRPSGFGLSFDDYVNWFTLTAVGVRLCFTDLNVLKHVVKYFINEYNDLLLL